MSFAKCFLNETTFVSEFPKDFGAIAEFSAFDFLKTLLTFPKLDGSVYLERSPNGDFSP